MQKGFNLFTALVALMLIVISVLLTQAMTRTQRNFQDIYSSIEEEQKMLAIADLAKADALQVFNFGIRFAIEDWLTYDKENDGIPDNAYLLTPDKALQDDAWEKIKTDFAQTQFGVNESGGNQLAFLASQHLTSLLLTTPDVRGFTIDLPKPNEAELRVLLQKVFNESSLEQDFFHVIDCDGTVGGCSKGTFYVNLNLKSPEEGGYLTDEEYEKFPQISVTNNETGRVLKQPILPRGNLQIYVPIRLFKALTGALAIAKANSQGVFEIGSDFHEQVNRAQAGICDAGSCNARSSPFDVVTAQLQTACYNDRFASSSRDDEVSFGHDDTETDYDPGDSQQQGTALREIIKEEVIEPLIEQLAEQRSVSGPDFLLSNVVGNAGTFPVKSRDVKSSAATTSPNDIIGESFCSEVGQVEAVVVFEEKNKNYIVSTADGESNFYAVKLFDNNYELFKGPGGVCTTTRSSDLLESFVCNFLAGT